MEMSATACSFAEKTCIKMYLAAISACHVGFGSAPIGQNSQIRRFMKGGH